MKFYYAFETKSESAEDSDQDFQKMREEYIQETFDKALEAIGCKAGYPQTRFNITFEGTNMFECKVLFDFGETYFVRPAMRRPAMQQVILNEKEVGDKLFDLLYALKANFPWIANRQDMD